jgi:hypothetical protein
MEELLSTEALDKEILEDARKKAHKILKSADDALASQKQDWDRKTLEVTISLRNTYEERLKDSSDEIFARLPLDKRRLRSESAESFLNGAMAAFLRSLKRNSLLAILGFELSERLQICAADFDGAKPIALFSGMDISEIRQVLLEAAKILGSGGLVQAFTFKEAPPDAQVNGSAGEFPFVIINTDAVKITASVVSAAWALLASMRAELAEALLGKGSLDD